MIKIRKQSNFNTLIILSFFSLFLFFVISCNYNNEERNYNGKWILKEPNYTEKIFFQDGNYRKEYSSDDIIVDSNGKFYLNKNENRLGITLTLIPNKIIIENDTIFQECENIEVIEINDSILKILKPNQGMRDVNDKFILVNEILIYKKIDTR